MKRSQEILSFLVKHLKHKQDIKRILRFIVIHAPARIEILMYLGTDEIIKTNKTDIEAVEQKLLTSGHSYSPNDSDFVSV